MDFIYYCPYCKQKLECDESLEGTMLNCPSCNEVITPKKPAPQIRVARDQGVTVNVMGNNFRNASLDTSKKRWVYILLGIFLGEWGAHNFYAGYTKEGLGQIGLMMFFVATLLADARLLCVMTAIAIGAWVIVNIAFRDKDVNGNPMIW